MTPKPYASPALTWFQPKAATEQAYTMGIANDSEKLRTDAVKAEQASNVWRGSVPATPWGKALNQ